MNRMHRIAAVGQLPEARPEVTGPVPGAKMQGWRASLPRRNWGMSTAPHEEIIVREFRQVLFWPLQLTPLPRGTVADAHWELLGNSAWREVEDEFADPACFPEHRYSE